MSDSKLPAGWSKKPLGALVSFQKGRKTDTSKNALNGYARYLGASGLSGKDDGFADMAGAVIAEPSDLLMLWDGERSGLVGYMQQGVVASTVSRLTPTDEIDSAYLYYKLVSLFDWIQARRTGTGVPHVPKDLGKILDIIYPKDKSVQRNIATILRTIDNQIDATQALIDKYTAIKQGMMADLFSRGIDPETKALRPTFEEAPELYHKTPLGMLPKGWDVEVLGDLASIASGITLGKDLSGVRTVLVPYLRVANVQDGYLDLSEVKSIAVPEVDADKYVLQYGDVLMNEGGDFDKLGRGTVWREEIPGCCHQNHVFRVRADNRKLRFDYLAYWSASSFGKHYFVLNSKQSTNLASINSTQLKAFPVAKPTLEEQEEIESRLQSVDGLLRSSKDELHKLIAQKSGLMQDLLTGKVSVPA
ncbi:restriction endonuclease subunit S [Vibrio parahaemolyticus]|nr:restriction endonuclease subunit S [Vibrio parahaemolyticus]EGQ8898183.1 restriction endonuclease subunit S [Vibrio parahaemolyticus]EIJ2223684.1 restriction endonuclease subunit S [Vibrio parahaemolyticus]EJG0502071.1 restriction endonuclease subunit S [Vibrio parahaemolyticus]EJG1840951.1 restriction endonuclease subunit S [Vibrio parahaemolyticus]